MCPELAGYVMLPAVKIAWHTGNPPFGLGGAMSHAYCIIRSRRTTRKTKYPCLMGISMEITQCASNRHANHVIRVNHGYGLQHLVDHLVTPTQ